MHEIDDEHSKESKRKVRLRVKRRRISVQAFDEFRVGKIFVDERDSTELPKAGNLVVDTCAGTLSFAKACTLSLEHRTLITCEVDQRCVTEAASQLILLYTRQLLSGEPEIDEEESTCGSAGDYVMTVELNEM